MAKPKIALENRTPKRAERMQALVAYIKQRLPPERRKTLIEVGSFCGASTEVFASIFQQVIAVDAWDVSLYPKGSKDAVVLNGQEELTQAEAIFDAMATKVGNVTKIKLPSVKAAVQWAISGAAPYVTALYLDAGHDEPSVTNDIAAWASFARCLVMGHDYSESWPGVRAAVNKKYGKPTLVFPDSSWVVDVEERARAGR